MYNPGDIAKIGANQWLAVLQGVVNLIPGATQIIDFIKTLTGYDLTDLFTGFDTTNPLLQQIISAAGGTGDTLTHLEDAFSALGGAVETLWTEFQTALGASDPASAAQQLQDAAANAVYALTNLINPSRIPLVPVSHIGNVNPELLINGSFNGTISMDGEGIWAWDGTVDHTGTTGSGSAKVTADGHLKTLVSNGIDVAVGQSFNIGGYVAWSGVSATGAAFKLQVLAYLNDSLVSTTDLATITSPASSSAFSSNHLTGTYNVVSGIDKIRVQIVVMAAVTAGNVWWDDLSAKKAGLLQLPLVRGISGTDLATDLATLSTTIGTDWNSFVTNLTGRLTHLANAGGIDAAGLTNITGIPAIPQANITDLATTFSELQTIFSGSPATIATTIGTAVNTWWTEWFAGGPNQVVPQSAVGAASGAAPTGADGTIPMVYLPPSLQSLGGVVDYVRLTLPGNQSISNASESQLTSLAQVGSATVTFSGSDWSLPWPGWWDFEYVVPWAANTTGVREACIKRNSTAIKSDGTLATSHVNYPVMNNCATRIDVLSGDTFGAFVYQNSGGSLNALAAGTYIQATFVGDSSAITAVSFDHVGANAHGNGSSFTFNQQFGPTGNCVVVAIVREQANSTIATTVTCGGYSVPAVSGPTYIGNFSGYNSYSWLFAAILPSAVNSTTKSVVCSNIGGTSAAFSAMSVSASNVGTLGSPVVNSGGIGTSPSLHVPSNPTSLVVMQFAAGASNFSSFSQVQDDNIGWSAFSNWAQLLGHGAGGSVFTATNSGDWSAKGIELHP